MRCLVRVFGFSGPVARGLIPAEAPAVTSGSSAESSSVRRPPCPVVSAGMLAKTATGLGATANADSCGLWSPAADK